ncbi:MAG: arsenate reductase [Rhodospirillales bacterium]
MLNIYGLKNCDTCRKALKWLEGEGIAYVFVDVRKDGIDMSDIERWAEAIGIDSLLNKRGTTWRGLSDADKARGEGKGAVALMATHPALIKRPVFVRNGTVMVGFTDAVKTLTRT